MKPRLLVVDDDAGNRDLLETFFTKKGYDVVLAPDGQSGLDIIDQALPDAVLLDVMMPGMTGIEALAEIRKKHSGNELPVIMATALSDAQDVVRALELGANDYVTKPFSLPVLHARVQTRIATDRVKRGELRPEQTGEFEKRPAKVPFRTEPGAVLEGRYRLETQVGKGMYGVVYRGRHLALERDVAIKILHEMTAADPVKRRRFEQEGVAACRLDHPNAVTVMDYGCTDDGTAYLVMEILEGKPLDELLKESPNSRLPIERAVELMMPVCFVLAEAHARGIVHRDVKPANVFLHSKKGKEVVKVLDFGLAKFLNDATEPDKQSSRIVGTPAYMAPERVRGAEYDGTVDVYSVGCMLFELLAGRPPFVSPDHDPVAVAIAQTRDPVPDIRAFRPEVSEKLATTLNEVLDKDAAKRPSAALLAVMLADSR